MKNENEVSEEDGTKKKIKINYECSICGQKFKFSKVLEKHELRHKGIGGFNCRTCGMSFTSAEEREKHRDKEHKILRCRICNIKFEEEAEYLQHVNSLHDGRDRELSICSECGKQFKTKGELMHHVLSKCGTIKRFKCPYCTQTLMTAGSLHNHLLRHTGQRTYMCRFCAKTFLTAGQLTVHERIHTQEKAFVCEVCNKGFCHRQSLITHSTLHTGIKPYQCEGCGNSFSCIGNLLKHRKTHIDSCGKIPLTTHRVKNPATRMKVQANTPSATRPKTLEKKKKLESAKSLQPKKNNENNLKSDNVSVEERNESMDEKIYIKSKDYELDEKMDDSETKDNLINDQKPDQGNITNILRKYLLNVQACTSQEKIEDDKNIRTLSALQKNDGVNIKQEDNPIEDDNVQNDFFDDNNDNSSSSIDSIDLYTRKINSELNNIKTKKNGEKKKNSKKGSKTRTKNTSRKRMGEDTVSCKYCGNSYTNFGWLVKHEEKCALSKESRSYKCSCCNSTFLTKEACVAHQQFEHSDILSCKECDKIFANQDSVKAHINFYHKGIPRKVYIYVCDKCGQVFKQKALLVTHEQNNCGDGPSFKCHICEKSFSNKHVRKSHMRVHAPEKPLLCKFCGKSFHWKGQLKIHERSHTGEKPFKCSHCPKAFSYRESLLTHNTLHTGIRPHLCDACGTRFSCIGNLLKHRRTHANTCGTVTRIKTEDYIIK